MFYANWCPHCKNFKDTYNKLGQTADFADVVAIDCAVHEGVREQFNAPGFPTLQYIRKDGTMGAYPSNREFKTLLSGVMKVCSRT